MNALVEPSTSGRASWISRWGSTSWYLVGMAVLASIVIAACSALSGIVIPFVVAVVIGTLAAPLIDWFAERHVPRPAGALIVMVALGAVIVGAVLVTVAGILDQSDEIYAVVSKGLTQIDDWLVNHQIDTTGAEDQLHQIGGFAGPAFAGVASYLGSIFSGALALAFGIFLATFMLYYVLTDFHGLKRWLGAHIGVPADLGANIVADSVTVLRRGFAALTLSSLCTAILIGLTMLALGLPLAFTVAIVTFVTSYIPYLGAIVAGAFGFLVALGSGGTRDAVILLIVILIVQNVVQTVVGTRLTSHTLSIHPLVSLISTIVGAALAGFLGAMLSAPIVAMIRRIVVRVREYQPAVSGAAPSDAAASP